MRNTYLYGFATFGHPNDYRQNPFIFDNEGIAKNVKIFDLPNAIKVFPNSTLYAIRKENVNGVSGVSYTIYTFANEMSSMRDGTFIGSSILFTNEIAEESTIISKLNQFHSLLVEKNTLNDILQVKHSKDFQLDTKSSKHFFQDFEKIVFEFKPISDIESFSSSNKNIVVGSRTDENTLSSKFNKSLLLLNKYDTIYFTSSRDVLEYCRNRNIYPITDEKGFEQEIQVFEENKKQKTLSALNEFENEKQDLENDRKKSIENFKFQIEQNEQLHEENRKKIEDSKKQLSQIHQQYDNYSNLIDKSINDLKSNRSLELVKQVHYSNKREFISSLNQQTKPNYINKISHHNVRTELKQPFQPSASKSRTFEDDSHGHERKQNYTKKSKLDIFKILTFILFLLWIVTLGFFIFLNDAEKNNTEVRPQEDEIQTIEQPQVEPIQIKELTPKPNKFLTIKEYTSIAKKITIGMPVNKIVQIIFEANPTDIKNHYSAQIEEYAILLVNCNKECFKADSSTQFFSKDTLRNIPSYKTPK